MMDPKTSAQRIPCPRCAANNFPGTAVCWRCSASLPPPEAAGALSTPTPPRVAGRHAAPVPQAPSGVGGSMHPGADASSRFVQKWGMSPGTAAALAAVGLGAFLIVWQVGGRLRGGAEAVHSAPTPAPPIAAPSTTDAPLPAGADDGSDPLVAESKRFIERESRRAGLPDAPTGPDGRVYLQGGGSITAEQYRDARRRVSDSPVLRTPIPAPPMP